MNTDALLTLLKYTFPVFDKCGQVSIYYPFKYIQLCYARVCPSVAQRCMHSLVSHSFYIESVSVFSKVS